MYDNMGQPIWYVSTASLQGAKYLSGSLLQYSNGQSLTGTYKPAAPLGNTIGNMAFNFTSADTANMVLPNGVVVPLKDLYSILLGLKAFSKELLQMGDTSILLFWKMTNIMFYMEAWRLGRLTFMGLFRAMENQKTEISHRRI
jgi:hypothetical protein